MRFLAIEGVPETGTGAAVLATAAPVFSIFNALYGEGSGAMPMRPTELAPEERRPLDHVGSVMKWGLITKEEAKPPPFTVSSCPCVSCLSLLVVIVLSFRGQTTVFLFPPEGKLDNRRYQRVFFGTFVMKLSGLLSYGDGFGSMPMRPTEFEP